MIELQVKGLRELSAALLTFPEKMQRTMLIRAMRAGAMVIRNLAREKVSVVSGKLRRSIRVSVRMLGGTVVAKVLAGRNKSKNDPFYAHMVEGGTQAHEIRPKGKKSLFLAGLAREQVKHPGAVAKPFMRPALEEGGQKAFEEVARALGQELGNREYESWS